MKNEVYIFISLFLLVFLILFVENIWFTRAVFAIVAIWCILFMTCEKYQRWQETYSIKYFFKNILIKRRLKKIKKS
jgi:hypothetical protein